MKVKVKNFNEKFIKRPIFYILFAYGIFIILYEIVELFKVIL